MSNTNRKIVFKIMILALCMISVVYVYVFPLYKYDTILDRMPSRTFIEFEQTLCSGEIKHHESTKRTDCPRNGIVTVIKGGRLGNQMWEYASVWGIAKKTKLSPYIPQCIRSTLDLYFDSLTLPTFADISHCPEQMGQTVETFNAWKKTNKSITLPRYVALADVVIPWMQDIVKEFSFKKTLQDESQRILHLAANNHTGCTFVGVHVRRTDYLGYLKKKYAVITANATFFEQAMHHMERRHVNVIFIVVSDDPKWCKKKFAKKRNAYICGIDHMNSPGLDLAILASCNHSIIDYGTYGTWGALLAGGETIYYNISRKHSSQRVGQLFSNWYTI